jgi:hypothetical protein
MRVGVVVVSMGSPKLSVPSHVDWPADGNFEERLGGVPEKNRD